MQPESEEPSAQSIRKAKQSARQIMRKSTILTLSLMVLLIGISVVIINSSVSPFARFASVNKQKGVIPVKLGAFLKSSDGKLIELQRKAQLGDLISFKVSTTRPIYTGLAIAINHQKPQIAFKDARIPPGRDRLLEKEDHLYTYELKSTDRDIKFCIITSGSFERLYALLRKVQDFWDRIDDHACVQVM